MDKVEITKVSIKRIDNPTTMLVAVAEIKFSCGFSIKEFNIIKKNGLLLVFGPSRRESRYYHDIIEFQDENLFEEIKARIIEQYEKELEQDQE